MLKAETKVLQTSQQVLTNISESVDIKKDTIALIENINYIKDEEGMIVPWNPIEESPYGIPFHASTDNKDGNMGYLYSSDLYLEISIFIGEQMPDGFSIIKEGSYDNVRLKPRWSDKDRQNIVRYLLVPNRKMTVNDFIDNIADLGIKSWKGSRPYATPLTQCGWIRYFNQYKDDDVAHVHRGIAHMMSHGSRDLDSLILNHAIEMSNEKTLGSLCENLSNAKLLFSVISDPQFIKVCDDKAREIILLFLEQKFKWCCINRSVQPERLLITYS